MTLLPVAPPQAVPIFSGFDYVTVDVQRRRVYTAHTGSARLAIVDADSGAVLGQIKIGSVHGVAVDPVSGHVFTGNGTDNSISEVDPVAMKVLRTTDVGGAVDAVAYDSATGHVYADEDDGTHVYVLDGASMKSVGTVDLPGHKPEYLDIDPKTHDVYQNIANLGEYVVIDAKTLKVKQTVRTPEITGNHPLQYDDSLGHVLVGGQNGMVAAYDRTGTLVGKTAIQARVDQCSLDRTTHLFACAGSGMVTVLRDNPSGAPTIVAQTTVPAEAHTIGLDGRTGQMWIVWAQPGGDFVQAFKTSP